MDVGLYEKAEAESCADPRSNCPYGMGADVDMNRLVQEYKTNILILDSYREF